MAGKNLHPKVLSLPNSRLVLGFWLEFVAAPAAVIAHVTTAAWQFFAKNGKQKRLASTLSPSTSPLTQALNCKFVQ